MKRIAKLLLAVLVLCGACDAVGLGGGLEGGNPLGDVPGGITIPGNVQATATSASEITVSWSGVSGASGYYVYRAFSASGTYSRVGTISATSYKDAGLSANTPYYYKVSAYNSSGTESPLSSPVHATTLTADGGDSGDGGNQGGNNGSGTSTVPGAPANVSVKEISPARVTVSWSAVPGATGYNVYSNYDWDWKWFLETKNNTSTSVTIPTFSGFLQVGTIYFKVSAVNSAGEGPESSPVSVTIPYYPEHVTASAISSSAIEISWSAVPGATGYSVMTDGGNGYDHSDPVLIGLQVEETASTTVIDTNLNAGTTYAYQILPLDSGGYSSVVTATTWPE